MITGLNHVTFGVRQLEASFGFYTEVLGLRPALKWSGGAYLRAGDFWVALISDHTPSASAPSGYSHVAFTVEASNFETLSQRIRASGARIWQENQSEGPSLYFTDPDGHQLEIHASDLKARLRDKRLHRTADMHFFAEEEAMPSPRERP